MAKPMKMAKSKKGKPHRKLTAKLLPSVRTLSRAPAAGRGGHAQLRENCQGRTANRPPGWDQNRRPRGELLF